MSTEHRVPSPEFWAITPFRFETPDGWSARQTAQHLAYLQRDDDTSSNCGIQWKRIPASVDLRRIAQVSMTLTAKEHPDIVVGVSRYGRLHGKMSYLRISEFTTADGDRVGQVYVAFTGPILGLDRPIELFEITGHFDAGHPNHINEIQAIVKSFQFVLAAQPVDPADPTNDAMDLTLAGEE